jgi:glucosamine-6-phosphate deaminase
VLVPLSQADLRLKVLAIYRHQSQKDEAPFPGPDPREFWERVQDRNRATAAELERLGLPAYYAMEAFVVEQNGVRLENHVVPTSSLAEGEE